MPSITPFLWFDSNAEQAMNFYLSVFKDSEKLAAHKMGDGPDAVFFSGSMRLLGQEIMLLNGGPHYQFSSANSFFINCEDQAEVDYYWDHLLEGGKSLQCGWLVDQFGVTWQVIPKALGELLGSPDRDGAKRAMDAMMQMTKLDVATLQTAHDGE